MKRLIAQATLIAATIFSNQSYASIEDACGQTTWQLTAGQTINVGTVTVSNDTQNLYVNYNLTYPGATFGTLHMWAGNNLDNLPANQNGTPVPGQFCQADGGACYDASGLTSYTFTIPFADLNIVDVASACPLSLYVVTHAEVKVPNGDGGYDNETAFGGPTPGSGPRWWFYGLYNVCCPDVPPPVPHCETAFGKPSKLDGGWIWTTDKKSNPEKYPSLNLTRNRWGWAAKLPRPGVYTEQLWAGAGLNNTANGVNVGTVVIDWNGTMATVTYNMSQPEFSLEEVHLYANDLAPRTIAPGQFGYTDSFDPNVSSYTFNVPLSDINADGSVWVIAHSVVCIAAQ